MTILIIILLLFTLQAYTLSRIISLSKIKKESEAIIEKYKSVTTLAKIPKRIHYSDVEPDWKTFYDFMENIKLEGWNAKVSEDRYTTSNSSWVVDIISHDEKSSMTTRLRDYGDGVFLAHCNIRAGVSSLVASKEDKIATDIILFVWDYIIKQYEDENNESIASYKNSISRISEQLKTLNRSQRLNNILEI